jgi:hypothetical protein
MRLKSINVYSDFIGDSEKTKERTRELRADSDFLDYIFWYKIKYADNAYLRQLNLCCSPTVKEICISSELSDGYPQISVPFDYSIYIKMNEEGKENYWINTIEAVFNFLEQKMKCGDDKINNYIAYLRTSDIKMYKEQVRKSYKSWAKTY